MHECVHIGTNTDTSVVGSQESPVLEASTTGEYRERLGMLGVEALVGACLRGRGRGRGSALRCETMREKARTHARAHVCV